MLLALAVLLAPSPLVTGAWAGNWLQAKWKAESEFGGDVQVDFSLRSGKRLRRNFGCNPDWWPEDTNPRFIPAVTMRETGKRTAIVFLTYKIPSGVYGYRRVMPYLLSNEGALRIEQVMTAENLEFSDFGSWNWDGKHQQFLMWDMYYVPDEESHASPHRCELRRYGFKRGVLVRQSSERTKLKYIGAWGSGNPRGAGIPAVDDPLREFGLRWRWWGE